MGEKKRLEIYKETYQPLTDYLKKLYEAKISKVIVSPRVETTPCILVTSQYGNSANMERLMRSQAFSDPSKAQYLNSQKRRRTRRTRTRTRTSTTSSKRAS